MPELNRISFVNYKTAENYGREAEVIIMAEFITEDRDRKEELSKKIKLLIERYLGGEIQLEGCTYSRPIYTLDDKNAERATTCLKKYIAAKSIKIPKIYYGPINMAKGGIIASEFSLEGNDGTSG